MLSSLSPEIVWLVFVLLFVPWGVRTIFRTISNVNRPNNS